MDSTINKPNLFIIGVPKAGTTSLYEYLKLHPNICASSIKEPNFFTNLYELFQDFPEVDEDIYISSKKELGKRIKENPHFAIIKQEDLYLSLFKVISHDKNKIVYRMEATPNYFHYSDLYRILNYSPDSKFILILRNPIDRAWSDFLMGINVGLININYKYIHNIVTFFSICKTHKYILKYGFYSNLLIKYESLIKKGILKIILYDEFKKNQVRVLTDILKFLELPEYDFKSLRNHIYNVTSIPKYRIIFNAHENLKFIKKLLPHEFKTFLKRRIYYKPPIHLEIREELKQIYKEDINQTSKVIKKDLSFWLK